MVTVKLKLWMRLRETLNLELGDDGSVNKVLAAQHEDLVLILSTHLKTGHGDTCP